MDNLTGLKRVREHEGKVLKFLIRNQTPFKDLNINCIIIISGGQVKKRVIAGSFVLKKCQKKLKDCFKFSYQENLKKTTPKLEYSKIRK